MRLLCVLSYMICALVGIGVSACIWYVILPVTTDSPLAHDVEYPITPALDQAVKDLREKVEAQP